MDVSIRDKQCDATSRLPARIKCNLEQEKKKKTASSLKLRFSVSRRHKEIHRREEKIAFFYSSGRRKHNELGDE